MARCDQCGNEYDRAFKVIQGDRTMTFDSFECAIQAMAPRCAHCGCAVIGHGVETGEGKSSAAPIVRSRKASGISRTAHPIGLPLDFRAKPPQERGVKGSRKKDSRQKERGERLAIALKANIKRRKNQARARGEKPPAEAGQKEAGKPPGDTP
jgi:hypothetical protein